MNSALRPTFPAHFSAATGSALGFGGHLVFAALALLLLAVSPSLVHPTLFAVSAQMDAPPALEIDNALARR